MLRHIRTFTIISLCYIPLSVIFCHDGAFPLARVPLCVCCENGEAGAPCIHHWEFADVRRAPLTPPFARRAPLTPLCALLQELWAKASSQIVRHVGDASRYGELLVTLWARVKEKLNHQQFGALMRKNLLTGSQWVVTMAQRLIETQKLHDNSAHDKAHPPKSSWSKETQDKKLAKAAEPAGEGEKQPSSATSLPEKGSASHSSHGNHNTSALAVRSVPHPTHRAHAATLAMAVV